MNFFLSTCPKWGCFVEFQAIFCNLIGLEHFGLYLRFYPNMEFVQEYKKWCNFFYCDQIFLQIQKTIILAYFPNFWGKNFSSEKSGPVRHILIRVSSMMPKFRKKLMIQFPENVRTYRWTDRRTEGRKDHIL